jgi:hypothetical protein
MIAAARAAARRAVGALTIIPFSLGIGKNMSNVKSRRAVVEYLTNLGLEVELNVTKNHLRYYCKKGTHEKFFVKANSPSDYRAELNFQHDVRRWLRSLPTENEGN